MKHRFAGLALLAVTLGCGNLPSGPQLAADGAALSPLLSPLHYDHTAFAGGNITQASAYFHPSAIDGNGDGTLTVGGLVVGNTITGFRASLYVESTNLQPGWARIADVTLWRVGVAPFAACPTLSTATYTDVRQYCPIAWVHAVAEPTGTFDPDGWILKSMTPSWPIETGFTYQVIANLRGHSVGSSTDYLRLAYAEMDYSGPGAAPPARIPVLAAADRARLLQAAAMLEYRAR